MIQQDKMVRGIILLGLSLLGLALVWLFLSSVSIVQATPPIAGNPVSMSSASTVSTTSSPARAVAAADLDQDGRPDLAFGEGSSLRIVRNTGTSSPSWSAPPTTVGSTSYNVVDLVAVDIDRDSKTDLVTAASDASGNSELKLWRNPGGNPFTTWTTGNTPTSTANIALTTVAAGDLDGDGAPDLVTGGHDGIIRLWRNPITGTQPFTTTWDPPAQIDMSGAAINQVALADFDRDGRLDVVVVCGGGSGTVRWWRNPGAPFTTAWTESTTLGTLNGLSVAVADLDDDARPDVAAGDAAGHVYVWRNSATGWGSSVGVGNADDEVRALVAVDLDNDGYPDLVGGAGDVASSALVAWHNDRSPFSGDDWQALTVGTPSDSIYNLTAADFERDGDLDIASGNGGAVLLWPNTLIHRDAAFENAGVTVGPLDPSQRMVIGDLDRDGRPDIVTDQFVEGFNHLYAWMNDGTPFSANWPSCDLGENNGVVPRALADIDSDGDLDIVAINRWNPRLEVWQNDGDSCGGTWPSPQTIANLPAEVSALAVGDLDGNGTSEIVAGLHGNDSISPTIEVWRFEGDPFATTWISAEIAVVSYTVNSIALGDLNNDGRLDIVFGTEHALSADPILDVYQLRAARNDGAPFDDGWTLFDLGRDPQWTGLVCTHGYYGATVWSVDVADFDNDGYLDIVTGEGYEGDHQVMVWKNDGTPFDGQQWRPTTTGLGPGWDWESQSGDPWLSATVRSVVAADFNGDGLMDLVSGSETPELYEISYWENTGVPFSELVTDTHWIRHYVGALDGNVLLVGAADFDSDGDMDIASLADVAFGDPAVHIWQNKGGVVGQVVSDTAPAEALGGTTHALMRVVVSHHGKAVDHDIELAEWRLTFEDETGTPLTSVQASALISNVVVYRDANDDSVWQLEDTPVVTVSNLALTSGVQTFSFTPGDPLAAISATETVTYFVVVTLKPNASHQAPSAFQVTFDPDAASVVKDRTNAASVSVNDTEPVTAGPVQAIAGPAANVNVEANPASIPANGTSTSVVTATVEDTYGNSVVNGTVVTFTTTLGSFPTEPYTTTTLSGVAMATLTSSTTVGTAVVTATAGTASGQVTVTFTADSAANVTVEVNPSSIPANGTSTSVVTATVKDACEHSVVDGTVVTFTTTLGSFPTVPYTTTTLGSVATATLTSSTTVGTAVVTATAGTVSGQTTVTFTVGNLHHILVNPTTVVLTPTATQLFTATGYDQHNNVVSGLTFMWSVVNGGGTIDSSRVFTAGTTSGTYTDTVQATAGSISGYASVMIEAGGPSGHLIFLPVVLKGQ